MERKRVKDEEDDKGQEREEDLTEKVCRTEREGEKGRVVGL